MGYTVECRIIEIVTLEQRVEAAERPHVRQLDSLALNGAGLEIRLRE